MFCVILTSDRKGRRISTVVANNVASRALVIARFYVTSTYREGDKRPVVTRASGVTAATSAECEVS